MVIDDFDITKSILIDKLIKDTTEIEGFWWSKKNHAIYTDYTHRHLLKNGIEMIFTIYHFKTHDGHTMNVYLEKGQGKYIPVLFVDGTERKLLDLIKTIIDTNSFYDTEI